MESNRKIKNEELNRLSAEEFKSAKKFPVVVVLDNIRSALNVGSVFRTADAFALEGLFLCGISSTPPNKEIHKSALGSTESVNWQYYSKTEDAIYYLKKEGYTLLAIEQAEKKTFLDKYKVPGNKKLALIFGNEVEGVEQQILDLCDGVIEIPQFGTKHSLNISVSAGIVIWEIIRQMIIPKLLSTHITH